MLLPYMVNRLPTTLGFRTFVTKRSANLIGIMVNRNINQTERDADVKDVSDKCSCTCLINVFRCSEQNYREAIESGLYPLKPPQVRVPRTLIIIRLLRFQWIGRSNGRPGGEVLLFSTCTVVAAIVHLLLAMSGDVEENPGPLGQGEMNMSLLKSINLCSLRMVRRTGHAVLRGTLV